MTESKAKDLEDEHVDGCVEDIEMDETEATLDVELPPARGGVEPRSAASGSGGA